MAVKNRVEPTWILLGSLALLFCGERLAGHGTARLLLSGLGALSLVGSIGWRATGGFEKGMQRLQLVSSLGALLAVLLYFAGSDDGVRTLKLHPGSHYQGAMGAFWPIVLGISLVPVVFALWAAYVSRPPIDVGGAPITSVEQFRVTESATNGLTIALAAAFLFVIGFVASERDAKVDVSYFRTSMPGTATVAMVSSVSEPLKVLLFFPEVNEVKNEVKTYFEELAAKTGRVIVEEHDKELSPKLAKDMSVYRDGTIVLARGNQHEAIPLDTKIEQARPSLRTLDGEVQKAFMKVARGSRTAYFTVGHAEANVPSTESQSLPDPMTTAMAIKDLMNILNYKVQDLGIQQGLAQDVPEDARIVFILGPKKPFLDEELASIDRFLARGGSVFLTFDPAGDFKLGPLASRLGVTYLPLLLADDHQFLARRNAPSDHRLLITDQFSTHASVTTLSHARAGSGLLAANTGSLELTDPNEEVKPSFTIRSLASTFADTNGDGLWEQGEERKSYDLVAAIEKPAENPDPNAKDSHPSRAIVYATTTMISDAIVTNVPTNAALVADNIKWLGGEEQFAGETTVEKDVEIEHTHKQDIAWFYSTVWGVPVLVFGVGMGATTMRRRKRSKS
jgi:hypothetical protein